MNYENFVFYGSFLKTVESIPDDYLKLQVLEAIVRYGCANELPNPTKEPMVYAFLQMAIPTIDKQKDNYANGSKGGRPVTHTQEEYNELFERGKTNKEVASILNVSDSTVERKKKTWKEAKARETEKAKEKAKEKESEDMKVLRVSIDIDCLSPSGKALFAYEKNCFIKNGYSEDEAARLAFEVAKEEA